MHSRGARHGAREGEEALISQHSMCVQLAYLMVARNRRDQGRPCTGKIVTLHGLAQGLVRRDWDAQTVEVSQQRFMKGAGLGWG